MTSVVLELVEGSSVTEIVSYARKVEKIIEEQEIWIFIIQASFMLKEFRRFGVLNSKMPANCLVWSDSNTLTYYPRSFTGIFTPEPVDIKGILYAPEKGSNVMTEMTRSDVYNLGLALFCIMKPDTEYFDVDRGCFDIKKLEVAHEKGINIFGDDPIEGYSEDLNTLVHDMLVVKPDGRLDIGKL